MVASFHHVVRDQAQVIRLGNKLVYPLTYPLRHIVGPKGFFVGFLFCFVLVLCLFVYIFTSLCVWVVFCVSVYLPRACSALRGERRALDLLGLTTKAGSCFMDVGTRTSERAGCAS